MRVSAACNNPRYQLRVSITTATDIPRCTVKECTTGSRASSRGRGSSGMLMVSATAVPRPVSATRIAGSERVSGGPLGRAATTRARVELGATGELRLALPAASISQHHVMRTTGPGGLLLGVTGAAVPDALSERRHRLSLPHDAAMRDELGAPTGASEVPLARVKPDADFTSPSATRREVSCPFRS